MPRPLLLSLIVYCLLLAGIVTVRGELIALALPFVVYLLAGFLRAPDRDKTRSDAALKHRTDIAKSRGRCDCDHHQSRPCTGRSFA